jgi:ankyrin repeat protein
VFPPQRLGETILVMRSKDSSTSTLSRLLLGATSASLRPWIESGRQVCPRRAVRRAVLAVVPLVLFLAGCRLHPDYGHIILSYAEDNSNCVNCASFHLEFRDGGHVDYTCLRGCAVPGYRHYLVPARQFRDAVTAFGLANFFQIPRTDPARIVWDVTITTLTWRDAGKIHEVVDNDRRLARLTDPESHIKSASGVERYLRPSAALYRSLVASGWDVNTTGQDGENALSSAVAARNQESVTFLLQHGSAVTDFTLQIAARNGDASLLQRLIAASHTPLDEHRCAALLVQAARAPSPDSLRLLLDAGCDVNSRQNGETALFSAVPGSLENLGFLLSRGADASARDSSGRTPLWYAAAGTNTGAISLLSRYGGDVNARDNQGRTPLMHASDLCFTWDIRALLNSGADPMLVDKRGRTALEPDLSAVGDPKCADAKRILREAAGSWPAKTGSRSSHLDDHW